MYSATAAICNWSERQDFHLRPPGPKPGALKAELRPEKMVSATGLAPVVTPPRTEHVTAAPRADDSERLNRNVGAEKRDAGNLGQRHRGKN